MRVVARYALHIPTAARLQLALRQRANNINMRADSLPGAEVFLSVNDAALCEHETETQGSHHAATALAYVEAVAGVAFAVDVNLGSTFKYIKDDLIVKISMDGHRVSSTLMDHGRRHSKIDRIHESNGGRLMIRRFLFAELHKSKHECGCQYRRFTDVVPQLMESPILCSRTNLRILERSWSL